VTDIPVRDWTGWRGPNRDGQALWLPETLAPEPKVIWNSALSGDGLAGVAATIDFVFLAGRDLEDKHDVFQCISAEDGGDVWEITIPATGELDYGNTPRATPLVDDVRVYFQGAFGDLVCVAIDTGEIVWKRNLYTDFGATLATWGACSSPLLAQGKLIVNPGAPEASIVALDPTSGKVIWQTAGRAAGYGSLIQGRFGGVEQIVGHDQETLGGWDLKTGIRLWEVKPQYTGDFNVPTPIIIGDRLYVVTENNGSRLYEFDSRGKIKPQPVSGNDDLAPDTASPVVINQYVVGCTHDLIALNLRENLKTSATLKSELFRRHASLIASGDKVLFLAHDGELALISLTEKQLRIVSRSKPFTEKVEIYSHPALVGSRLYLRGSSSIRCLELA